MHVSPVKEKSLLRSERLESWACLPAVGARVQAQARKEASRERGTTGWDHVCRKWGVERGQMDWMGGNIQNCMVSFCSLSHCPCSGNSLTFT